MTLPEKVVGNMTFVCLVICFRHWWRTSGKVARRNAPRRRGHGDSVPRVLTITCVTPRSKGQIGHPDLVDLKTYLYKCILGYISIAGRQTRVLRWGQGQACPSVEDYPGCHAVLGYEGNCPDSTMDEMDSKLWLLH